MASQKQQQMLALGAAAPDFHLKDQSGRKHTLTELAQGKPLLLAFFKVSCPTCQYALPFLERIYRGKTQSAIAIYAISQDDPESTRDFNDEFGITMPVLFDKDAEGYPASNAYGIAHVTSLFLIEPNGRISLAASGFDKKFMEELGTRLGKNPFEPGERVPDFRPG